MIRSHQSDGGLNRLGGQVANADNAARRTRLLRRVMQFGSYGPVLIFVLGLAAFLAMWIGSVAGFAFVGLLMSLLPFVLFGAIGWLLVKGHNGARSIAGARGAEFGISSSTRNQDILTSVELDEVLSGLEAERADLARRLRSAAGCMCLQA